MKIGRMLMVIIGAALGSLVAIWWVRNNGIPALPAPAALDETGDPASWIRLD